MAGATGFTFDANTGDRIYHMGDEVFNKKGLLFLY
jgi:hypothetical protein